jgi:O-antigen ligase
VFIAGAVLSGSRGGLLAFAAMCLLGGLPMLRRLPKRTAALFVTAGAVLLYTSSSLVGSAVGNTVQERYIQETLQARYDSGRSELMTQSWELFQRHFYFGAGLDGYFAEVGSQSGYQYPHNLVLSTAAEGGVVGLVLLLGAVAAFVVTARRTRPMSTEGMFLLLAGLFVLGSSLLSGTYYDSRFMWLFLGLAALEGQRAAVLHPEGQEDRVDGTDLGAGGRRPSAARTTGLSSNRATEG